MIFIFDSRGSYIRRLHSVLVLELYSSTSTYGLCPVPHFASGEPVVFTFLLFILFYFFVITFRLVGVMLGCGHGGGSGGQVIDQILVGTGAELENGTWGGDELSGMLLYDTRVLVPYRTHMHGTCCTVLWSTEQAFPPKGGGRRNDGLCLSHRVSRWLLMFLDMFLSFWLGSLGVCCLCLLACLPITTFLLGSSK